MEPDHPSSPADNLRNRILSLSFNQNKTLLSIGTTMGFRQIRVEDCKIQHSHDTPPDCFEGGFSVISSMYSTQLSLVVGSSENKNHVPSILYFWDEYQNKFKAEVRFRTQVKNVLVRRDKIIIILEKITYIYLLNTLKPVASISTIENELGVGSISNHPDIFVLATLDTNKGHVRIENFYTNEIKRGPMHDNAVVLLEVNYSGNLAASASEMGTVIRVFETNSLNVKHEFRRGSSAARITSFSFSPDDQYLLAASNRSTIHIWSLQTDESYSGMMTRFLPGYFQPTRSYFKLPIVITEKWAFNDEVPPGPVAVFVGSKEFVVAHLDGNLYYCVINADGAIVEKFLSFMEKKEFYSVDSSN